MTVEEPSASDLPRLTVRDGRSAFRRLFQLMQRGLARNGRGRSSVVLDDVLWLAWVPVVWWIVHALSIGWWHNILDHHAFRQSQTAIGVATMLRGGSWLAYETPVLGFPWALPFEFPVYQWGVALLAKTRWLPLDQAGRAVSVVGYAGCGFVLWRILRLFGLRPTERLPPLFLFLLSPTHLFWARTFMIESTALCAGLWFFERTLVFLQRGREVRPLFGISWAVSGVLAALIKAPTFMGFALASGIALAWSAVGARKTGDKRLFKLRVVAGLAVFGLCFVCLKSWVLYTDHLKSLNPLARGFLTSDALGEWMMGTWAQKTSAATWRVFLSTRMPLYLGSPWILLPFPLLAFVVDKGLARMALLSFVLFLTAFAVFTHLHSFHDYYQYANTVFLTSAVGLLLVGVMRLPAKGARLAAVAVTLLIGDRMVTNYDECFLPRQTRENHAVDGLIALSRAHTTEDELLYVTGAEWSPAIPYYAGRRALMDHGGRALSDPVIAEELRLLSARGLRFGALLSCGKSRGSPLAAERKVALGLTVLRASAVVGCDVYTR